MRAALAAVAVFLLAGCGTGGVAEPGSVSEGQRLFNAPSPRTGQSCASCHALAHAGAKGRIGPDLDAAFQELRAEDYDDSTIREIVDKQILYPVTEPPTGQPGMPADLWEGEEAGAIASYVACVAGFTEEVGFEPSKEWEERGCGPPVGQGGTPTGGQGGSDPKTLFASAGCAGCHALAAADASGTVGPNLDESDLTVVQTVTQIENGGGGMPAFRGDLPAEQIRALAEYIVENRK